MVNNNAFFVIPVIAMLFFLIPFVLRGSIRSSFNLYPTKAPFEGKTTENAAAFAGKPAPDIVDISSARELLVLLTPTERRVFELLCKGYGNIEISKSMYITTNTVKFHVRNILRKADAKNRFSLMARIKN